MGRLAFQRIIEAYPVVGEVLLWGALAAAGFVALFIVVRFTKWAASL